MAVFIPVEETQGAQKGVRDFIRVEWEETLGRTEVLEVEVAVVQDGVVEGTLLQDGVVEAVEGTLVEAVEVMKMIHVEEGEDLIMQEKISKTSVVTIQMVMVM